MFHCHILLIPRPTLWEDMQVDLERLHHAECAGHLGSASSQIELRVRVRRDAKVAHRLVEKAIDFVVGDGEDADYEVYFRDFVLEAFRGRGRGCRDWISMLRA